MSQVEEKCSLVSKRLGWIDIAKGIGILLVVFAHVNFTPALQDIIYSFHMPLFFVISGILFDRRKYASFKVFLKRKTMTLICPYVLFYMVVLLYTYLLKCITGGFGNFDLSAFLGAFLQMFLSQGSVRVVSAPLWFVLCLFAVELIYYFISKIDNKVIIALISAFLVVIGWVFETYFVYKYKILLPWSIDSACFALGFFAFGNLFSGLINQAIAWIAKGKYTFLVGGIFALVGFTVTAVLGVSNGHVSMGSKVLNNGFIFYITGIIGTLSVIAISGILEKIRFFEYCGRNSFCIMAVHVPIKKTYIAFTELTGFFEYNSENLIETIFPFIIVLSLSLLVVLIYNKFKCSIIKRRCA